MGNYRMCVATLKAKCSFNQYVNIYTEKYGFSTNVLKKKKQENLKNELKEAFKNHIVKDVLSEIEEKPTRISISCSIQSLTCDVIL